MLKFIDKNSLETLYSKYITLLIEVNDESKTEEEHNVLRYKLIGWMQGVEDASGNRFNGDYYYIDKFEKGEMKERPLCCGQFLDWKPK